MAQSQAANHVRHAKGQSFLIQIKFRQDSCWQGTIQWLEGKKTCSFRSLLEMLLLIDEALEKTAAPGEKRDSRSWEAEPSKTTEMMSLTLGQNRPG
ncbi:MAG: hypothetical protein KGZ32_02340 [Dethiobacter sp.]|nr:hypothetical protein [Dethiobacter sp.]